MAEPLHDRDMGAPDRGRRALGIFRRAGEIIFAGEQKQRQTLVSIVLDPAAQIAVDPIEIKIALEDAGSALLVAPQRLGPRRLRALRRDQTRHQRGADFAAMNVGTVEPCVSYHGAWKSAASSPINARNSAA